MKLAIALSERAELQKRVSEIGMRLNNNAKVQEGEEPAENPIDLLEELNRSMIRLEELIARINHTNNATTADGVTLTDLIAKRDCLKLKTSLLRDFLAAASERSGRYSRTEIKLLSTVPVAEMQKTVDALSTELRKTDEKIQELNWLTELL